MLELWLIGVNYLVGEVVRMRNIGGDELVQFVDDSWLLVLLIGHK